MSINIKNRKSSFEYHIISTLTAGISLLGTEIKSIRNNKANISDAYCTFVEEELFVKTREIHNKRILHSDSLDNEVQDWN